MTVKLLPEKTCRIGVTLTVILMMGVLAITTASAACRETLTTEERNQKVMNVTLAGAGVVTAWGVANWDYFSRKPHAESEGWFARNTDEGGADKLGHVFSTYATAQGISSLLEHWCFSQEEAAWYGAVSSFAILGWMEAGDSFSNYGFSYEDFAANALGSLASYYRYRHPEVARKIDFRWEFGLDPGEGDITTDYDNSKYLLALKLNGFERFNQSLLKHLELHAGYFVRGYSDAHEPDERNLYMGIGLNLTDFFRRRDYRAVATALNFLQTPGTYLAKERRLAD